MEPRFIKRRYGFVMLSVWFLFGLADQGLAAIPPTLNFQGYLTSTAGMPIWGSVAMSFSIYAQESESDFFLHCFFGILVKNARFQQLLINEVKILPQGFLGSADCGPTFLPIGFNYSIRPHLSPN